MFLNSVNVQGGHASEGHYCGNFVHTPAFASAARQAKRAAVSSHSIICLQASNKSGAAAISWALPSACRV
jgi:6-phosphogluconolactonase/glucosamine-6-phosphate isomerase/deaminase